MKSFHDLMQAYARLKRSDILPVWTINHGMTTSLYYADPDGVRVELQADNFDNPGEMHAIFRSDDFAKNPVGVEFDADALFDRFLRGDALEELRAQGATTPAALAAASSSSTWASRRVVDVSVAASPAQFAHVVLRTGNLKQAVEFYQFLLGAKVVFQNKYLVFLTYDEEHHRLALVHTPRKERLPRDGPGLEHIAYTFRSLHQLLQTFVRLRQRGILPAGAVNKGYATCLCYEDPDGNRVLLQVDGATSDEELEACLKNGPSVESLGGVPVDVDAMLDRYCRGEPADLLLRPAAAGPLPAARL